MPLDRDLENTINTGPGPDRELEAHRIDAGPDQCPMCFGDGKALGQRWESNPCLWCGGSGKRSDYEERKPRPFYGGPAVHYADPNKQDSEGHCPVLPLCGTGNFEEYTKSEGQVTCHDCCAILGIEYNGGSE